MIATYGARNASLYFGGRVYSARLAIADVERPLLGADFLRQHNLLVDLKGQRLIEGSPFSANICDVGIAADHHLALLYSTSTKFRKIIGELPPSFSSSTFPSTTSPLLEPQHMAENVVYPQTN